jgi:hypothetical protein
LGNDAGGGDGMSFGYGSLSGSAFGEAGTSSGVWISIDTHEGDQYSGRVYIIYNGTVVDTSGYFNQNAHSANGIAGRGYYTMTWSVTESGLFQYNHPAIGTRSAQLSGWGSAVQSNWRFGIGARTGAAYDEHAISDLTITDNTSTPTNLSLSASTVNENDSGATVGTLSTTDAGGSTSFTYSLVSGTGSTDNSSFQIVGNQLRTATGLNFEAGSSRSVRIRTTDQAGLSFERAFSISVTNLNEAPTDISLSGTTVSENQPAGTTVGSFSSSDPDSGNTFTYSLVGGTGSTDNGSFQIVGNSLRTLTGLNYEAGSTRSVRVRTSDQNGLTYDEAFTITVSNVNEAPTDITLSNTSVTENQPIGTAVGTLSAVDPDGGGSFTYQLVSGTGDTDNAQFEILNGELKTKAVFDFEVKPSYTVRLRTTDPGGLPFEKAITINVFDMDEIPPKVTNSSFLASGTLPANATSLTVTFSESMVGATTASNYELRRAGADGLLGNSDDPIVNISLVTMVTGTARLNFAALTDDVYRLTVKDAITDLAGNALDGDNSGISGAKWWRDFVVGPLNTSLTSANGLIFDPEIGGGGAGQLVHGPGFAFDGHGRLAIGSAGVVGGTSPILLRTVMASNSSSTLTGVATVPFNVLVSTAAGAPTPSTTTNDQTIEADGEYLIAARIALQNVSTNRAIVLSISKNGAVISSKIHQLLANMTFAYETVDVSDRLNLLAGDKVSIKLETIGGSSTLYTGNPHGSFFDVSRISQVLDSASAIPATVMSSNSTSTLPGLATVPFNLLVSTAPGAPAASTSASEQTVSSDGEYEVSARLTLQSVNTNRPVVLSILRDGALVSSKRYQLVANSNFAYETIDISDRLVLVAGNKISIRLETLSGSSTLYNQGAHAAFFQLSKVANGLEAISSIRTTVMQSDNTSTLSGVATVPFNLLVSTGNGSPSANTATSEQTVPTNGDYTVSARVTLQDVFTNRTVILSIARNGFVISSKIHQLLANVNSPYETVDITDRLNLVAGDKISIKLETLGANSKLWGVAHATSFQVSKNVDIPTATLADSGASFRTNPELVSSLSVSRKLTVPSAGSQDFARTIDSFSNSTGAAITAPIRIVGNLGSDATTSVFATSDGDLLVEPTDLWFGTDDADGTGTPAIIHLLHGPYGLQPTSVNVIDDNVEWTYDLTVPAGATRRLAYFTVLGTTRAEAIASADALVTTNGFGGEAAAFLTNDELSSLVNFQFDAAPIDLALSSNTVAENSPSGTNVGNFSTVDANSGDVFTYSLVSGAGDTDNAQFTIVGNTLKTVAPFDFETKSSYSVRVRTTDQGGLSFEKVFVVQVTDVAAQVGGVFDGLRVVPNALRLAAPLNELTVTFADALSTAGGRNGVNSVLNPSNWQILKNQADVTAQISNVTFGYDSERENYAAVLSFLTPLDDGQFTVRLKDSIHDESGASFDGDSNGTPGGDFVRTFVVAQLITAAAETRVNTTTTGDQTLPIIAMNSAGRSVVVWQSFAQDGNGWGVYAQRYDAAGSPVGEEILVPNFVSSDEGAPHVAMDAAGNFVVTWNALGRDGSDIGVYARRFNADGTPNGTDFLVNTHTTGDQRNPSVAMAPNGDFVISWESWNQDGHEWGVYAQRYNAAGVAQGPETLVNTNTTSFQWNTHLAIDAAGNYTIVWDGFTYDGNEWGVFGQRFSSTGAKLGGEFKINTFDAGIQGGNAIGMDDAGNFVVTWSSYAQDGSGNGIYGKRYASTGDALGSEFLVNTYSLGDQQNPGVTMDADGDFVITWASFAQDGDNWGVYGQRYAPSGVPQGGEFSLNTYTSSEQWWPNVGMNSNGDIAAVWHSFGQDGTDWGVYRRQFLARVTPTDISLSKSNLPENAGSNAVIGTLSAIDPDAGDTFTFSLPLGVGDNSAFNISGTTLRANSSFDFELKNSFSVTVRVTDAVNRTFEKQFTIQVTDVNEAPTEISLTNNTVPENSPAGTVVGILSAIDPDADDSHTFLVGTGDFTKFTVSGNQLITSEAFNFESQVAYSIGVLVADKSGLLRSSHFSIFVTDVNEAPTDVSLANSVVAENLPSGTSIGNFSTTDPDSGSSFTHTLISGTGDTDNAQFTIVGNTLKTVAAFDFETKSSYSIRVRTTDQGGLSFEKIFTISVTDVQEDVTAPQSLIAALPAASGTLTFPVTASAVDPGGVAASGVFEIDFYYSTGGSFVKFATSPASNPTANFTGAPNTTYWFRSIARDNAGNVESKTSADTYTRIGDVLPPTTQVTSATHNSGGLFKIHMTGSKIGGAPMTAFDVYVVIDSNAPVLIGTAGAGAATAGVYSASLLYQGITDGNSHSYRFYSVGKDSAGNVEAAPVSGDVTVTVSFSSGGLTLGAIDVQNGSGQRSYVRHLDLLFSSSTGLSSLANTGRVRVERFGIDATSVNPGTGTLVSGFTVNQSGNRLKIDFGATGVGGLRQAGNGFYRVLVDVDGNGNFTDAGDGAMEFHRLFGDADGNGIVDIADTNLVTSQIGRTGTNLDGDLDGNGSVNSTDRLFTVQQRGRKLLDPLLGWLDD